MDKKYPDGPWSFRPSIPEEGFECYWIENGVQHITSIDGPQSESHEAIARLCAAAPEMLNVLIEVLDKIPLTDSGRNVTPTATKARAIIAKALGTPNMPSDLREAFEKRWYQQELEKYPDGEYKDGQVRLAWRNWLACAKHVEEQMKDAERYRFLEFQARFGNYRGIISREAIDAAIAATKGENDAE